MYVPFTSGMFNSGGSGPSDESRSDGDSEKFPSRVSSAKKYPHSFTEQQLRQGCVRCIDNVKGLLNSALILLDHKESQQYSLGLYIYAIEEFGKVIMLKRQVNGTKAAYKEPNLIFENHIAKLLEGLKNLPAACGDIIRGIRIRNTSGKALTIKIGSDRKISRGANQTGDFFDTTMPNY